MTKKKKWGHWRGKGKLEKAGTGGTENEELSSTSSVKEGLNEGKKASFQCPRFSEKQCGSRGIFVRWVSSDNRSRKPPGNQCKGSLQSAGVLAQFSRLSDVEKYLNIHTHSERFVWPLLGALFIQQYSCSWEHTAEATVPPLQAKHQLWSLDKPRKIAEET